MERQPPQALSDIFLDIALADKETPSSPLVKQELGMYSAGVLRQALDILGKYGKTHQDGSQQAYYFETPIVTANVAGKEIQLTISASTPFYLVVKDKIRVYYADPTLSEKSRRQLFSIGQFGASVENWLGEPAKSNQIEKVSEILSFIEVELSENSTPKS